MQTVAANMGGMITPHGNPQNLYLYSFFNIPTREFISILLPQAITVALMLGVSGMFIKNEKLTLRRKSKIIVDKKTLNIYVVVFVIVILSLFRVIPNLVTLLIVIITILLMDRKRFRQVDYALLATFCVFFVFSGNIARIEVIREFIASIVTKNTLVAGIVSCQFISNVPTAIFLSKFTNNYTDLLIAVNIGSLGIIISSLASLITLKEFLKHQPDKFWKYLGMFTFFNTMFLSVLLLLTNYFY